jgi:hypothetical protein
LGKIKKTKTPERCLKDEVKTATIVSEFFTILKVRSG